ncbi:hypothetical protein Tco_0445991 [Tanacetum coccineum]
MDFEVFVSFFYSMGASYKEHLRAPTRRHPRGGAELSQFSALQAMIGDIVLTDQCDSWQWLLDVYARVNLDRKCIDVGLILCPICEEDVEMVNHIFFTCDMADLWALVARWWELDILEDEEKEEE